MYFIDVYKINNPYTKDTELVEQYKTKNLVLLFEQLTIIREKYDALPPGDSFLILAANSQERRELVLESALTHLAYKPEKLEIN